MEDNLSSPIISSRSLVRATNSLTIVNKLILEKDNRDRIQAEYHYNLGKSKLLNDPTAIEDFTAAIVLDPNNSTYYSNRAWLKDFYQDFIGAIEDYSKAIEANPTSDYYCKRGHVKLYRLNAYKDSIEDYAKAIKLSPNLAVAHHERGIAEANLKFYYDAIVDFTKAIELNYNSSEWDPYYHRALAKFIIQDYKGAIEDFTKTIELGSSYYIPVDEVELAFNDRGLAKFHLRDYDGAIKDFTGAIWNGERYRLMYNHRIEPESVLGEPHEKADHFTKSVSVQYLSHANSYYSRGIVKKLINDDSAEADINSAKRIQGYANRGNI